MDNLKEVYAERARLSLETAQTLLSITEANLANNARIQASAQQFIADAYFWDNLAKEADDGPGPERTPKHLLS